MGFLCTVGLTGGLASGKSSVAGVLAGWGVPVFDADRAVHRLYGPGEGGALAVAALFGSGVLDPDGRVDRVALARTVLEDEEALDRLNRLGIECLRSAHAVMLREGCLSARLTRWQLCSR